MKPIHQYLKGILYACLLVLLSAPAYSAKPVCDIPDIMIDLGEDLDSNSKLKQAVKGNRVEPLVTAWKTLYTAKATKAKRSALELLEGIDLHFSKDPFKNDPALQDDYINAIIKYTGKISTSVGEQGSDLFPEKAEDFFKELFEYSENFYGKTGFSLKEASHTNFNVQDGFYLAMRYMNDKINPQQVSKIDMKFASANGCSTNCRFDTEIKKSATETVRYEFKSYSPDTQLKQVLQLVEYIKAAENLESFKYVFNKDKLTLQQAKDKMAIFITANKEAVFKEMSDEFKDNAGFIEDSTIADFTPELINNMVDEIVEVY